MKSDDIGGTKYDGPFTDDVDNKMGVNLKINGNPKRLTDPAFYPAPSTGVTDVLAVAGNNMYFDVMRQDHEAGQVSMTGKYDKRSKKDVKDVRETFHKYADNANQFYDAKILKPFVEEAKRKISKTC